MTQPQAMQLAPPQSYLVHSGLCKAPPPWGRGQRARPSGARYLVRRKDPVVEEAHCQVILGRNPVSVVNAVTHIRVHSVMQ